ncbi:MAG TPA: TonB-dependent receptor [Gemmatimonadaceae bacterium]|nr:TonB-dependent receptor [Gemmatimonadaceae bacterium]
MPIPTPLIPLTLGLSLLASVSAAQDTTVVQLDTVVVSASKAPPGGAPVAQAVTVITGSDLRAAGIVRVSEALRQVPGAAVTGGGPVGAVTALFLRGGESRYTKVLLDGVAVNAVGGYFDFSHLTTDNVDRIEIVRGPGSVVYGADAMTGVVHIFTRKGDGPATVEAEARGGTYGTVDASAGLIGSTDWLQYSLAGARYATNGILPFNNEYTNRTLSGSARFAPGPATRLDLSARLGSARYHYPTDFLGFVEDSNSFRDQRRFTFGLDASHRLSRRAEVRVLAGSNRVNDLTDDIEPPSDFTGGDDDIHMKYRVRTQRESGEVRFSFGIGQALVTTGAEYVRETERSVASEGAVGGAQHETSAFAGTRETRVGFAELAGAASRLEYTVSGRVDRPSDFGSFGTYRLGLATRWGRVRFRTAAATAFNAPAFSQLLPTEFTLGSPDLDPERVRAMEAGVDWQLADDRVRVAVTWFDQRFLDLIQFVGGEPPQFLGSYANLAEARARGWEADLRSSPFPGWFLTASFTQLRAAISRLDERYEGSLEVGQPLIRRPRRQAASGLTYAGWRRGSVTAAVRYVGARRDLDFREFPSPMVELPAYTVGDIAASVRLLGTAGGDELSLTARIENLFDKRHEEVLYYEAPGRTLLIGARAGLRRR